MYHDAGLWQNPGSFAFMFLKNKKWVNCLMVGQPEIFAEYSTVLLLLRIMVVSMWPGFKYYGMDVVQRFLKSNGLKAPAGTAHRKNGRWFVVYSGQNLLKSRGKPTMNKIKV